jgi:cation transport ATPase
VGNVRFAVVCKNGEGDELYARERCQQVAQEWSRAMQAGSQGSVRDFVAMGDVDIRVIGADNQVLDSEVPVRQILEQMVAKTLKRKANKNIILGLSSILVWFVALLFYVIVSTLDIPNSWLAFFYAVPANSIVLLSLRSAWHDFRWNRALISTIMWGSILSIYATLLFLLDFNAWRIFLLGIPGQAAILLWFRMFRPIKNSEA